jgi:hypothetical protein
VIGYAHHKDLQIGKYAGNRGRQFITTLVENNTQERTQSKSDRPMVIWQDIYAQSAHINSHLKIINIISINLLKKP